jgi:hypothetical protein
LLLLSFKRFTAVATPSLFRSCPVNIIVFYALDSSRTTVLSLVTGVLYKLQKHKPQVLF